MYLGYQNGKIKFYTEQPLDQYIYNLERVEETDLEYVLDGDEYVLKDITWKEKISESRKVEFLSQFFEIPEHGFFRKQPKGYSSAVESLNTAFNIVSIIGNLPAGTLTFYEMPDFTIEEQCTEEWLVANSYKNDEMTATEFGKFYADFMTAWNTQEHQ